jgi:ABC-type nitrate/sulfonate/bicarbonate transport system substrate-binding protein
MKRKWWFIGTCSAAIVATALVWGNDKVQAAPKKELFAIKTPTLKNCGLAPWLVTDRLGYFAEEGIKIQYTGETQPAMVIPSIIKGNNDVSSSHPNTLATARAGGAKLIGVVRGGIEPPQSKDPKFRHMWFFVNPAKHPNVKTFADLKKIPGKLKIASSSKNICTDFTINKLADKYKIPRNKFEWVSMPDIQGIQALRQKLLDVGTAHPPFFKGNIDAGAIKIADSTETGLGETIGLTYYYFREDFVKQNPQAVAGFVRAIKRGQRWANTNPEKTAKWVEEVIGVPVTGNHFYSEDARIVEAQNDPWIKDLEEHKVIPRGKVTSAALVTHQFEQFGNDDKVYQQKLKKQKKNNRKS